MDKMCQKIGLCSEQKDAQKLLEKLLDMMHQDHSDYTLTFRYLSDVLSDKGDRKFREQFTKQDEVSEWLLKWLAYIDHQGQSKEKVYRKMQLINPAYIPRNHLVERIIQAAVDHYDFSGMKTLSNILNDPYKEQNVDIDYMSPPKPSEEVYQTFCGT